MHEKYVWTEKSSARNALSMLYEPVQPYIFFELCERFRPTRFYDVGANIGLYSIVMSEVSSLETITAFEPAPQSYGELTANISANSLDNRIQAINVALSSQSGVAEFTVLQPMSGANSLTETQLQSSDRAPTVSVKTEPLDKYVSEQRQSVALKIDVEGHELHVLEGARNCISQNDCLIQVELYRDVDAARRLLEQELGLQHLFHVGPDHYFSGGEANRLKSNVAEVFEAAVSAFVFAQHERERQVQLSPVIRRSFGGVLSVEISGKLAKYIRAGRRGSNRNT